MADEQDGWLDRETAETLLRGESLETVDPAVRDRAERLAGTLDALAAYAAPAAGELPGETGALAAFRKARADDAARWADVPAARGHGTAAASSDAGLIRIGPRRDEARRSRWGRPLRLGLAAALTAGMVGGVAVAAGTGVLPTPFGGTGPDPAATASSAATPDRPLGSASPLDGLRDGSTPEGAAPGPSAGGTPRAETGAAGGVPDRGQEARDRKPDAADGRRRELTSCRDLGAGKALDGARRRALTEAAGGSARVDAYCRRVLAGTGATTRDRTGGRVGDAVEGILGGTAGFGETRKGTGGKSDSGDSGGRDDDRGDRDGGGRQSGDDRGDDRGDEDDRGSRTAHRADGAGTPRPAHATGAPTALLPLPGRLPKYAAQQFPGLGNTA
ncbi:hypothetical protein AB0E77_01355 [Streptomyces sp. NPDC032940]|uniref:hypothetical protein n=1 Tax=Streptomyces sp. NPDC032940 TaxID=3155366 RepID=UPI0033C23C5E